MKTMKAIETRYKGYRFRSRLEARWAVFFDALDVKWEYEPEGFELGFNDRYLPDFRLALCNDEQGNPRQEFIEIKPATPRPEEIRRIEKICCAHKCLGLLLYGSPGSHGVVRIFPREKSAIDDGYDVNNGHIAFHAWSWRFFPCDRDVVGRDVDRAVYDARGARFEFGEKGAR